MDDFCRKHLFSYSFVILGPRFWKNTSFLVVDCLWGCFWELFFWGPLFSKQPKHGGKWTRQFWDQNRSVSMTDFLKKKKKHTHTHTCSSGEGSVFGEKKHGVVMPRSRSRRANGDVGPRLQIPVPCHSQMCPELGVGVQDRFAKFRAHFSDRPRLPWRFGDNGFRTIDLCSGPSESCMVWQMALQEGWPEKEMKHTQLI